METDLTPEEIRSAEFRTALRGLDRAQVTAFLHQVAEAFEQLVGEMGRLEARMEQSGGRDVDSELEAVGGEVGEILKTARGAAETMRERASLDAARWRSEAMEEAETNRREATADAEALRRDAWTTGTELLEQTLAEARSIREQAQRDVLTVMGEAEREAHRLTSAARREAEDLMRNTTMEAEKVASETTRRRDEIIEQANRQAAAAQERARALEQRRDELLEELENVRSTLSRLEGSLEERRESMELSSGQDSSVRVVSPSTPASESNDWEMGETVRVVRSDAGEAPPDEAQRIAEEVSADVARMRDPPKPSPQDAASPTQADPSPPPPREARDKAPAEARDKAPPEAEPEPTPEPEAETRAEPEKPEAAQPPPDDVDDLFRSLRKGGTVQPSGPHRPPVSEEPAEAAPDQDSEGNGADFVEERDTRLLPITNRALRGVKKAVTDLQNIALDGLRTDEAWRPDAGEIADALRGELITLWSESFAAGHASAEARSGTRLKRPATPHSDVVEDFAAAMSDAVSAALDESGEGQRERQSAASRVYRVWRTDEAERWVRELAVEAYRRGVEQSSPVNASPGG